MKYGMRFFGYCADMRLALTACFSAECFLSDRSLPEYVSFQELLQLKRLHENSNIRVFFPIIRERINLRDGAKVELFGLLNFEDGSLTNFCNEWQVCPGKQESETSEDRPKTEHKSSQFGSTDFLFQGFPVERSDFKMSIPGELQLHVVQVCPEGFWSIRLSYVRCKQVI